LIVSSSLSSTSSASSRFGSDVNEEVFYNALDEVDQAESDLYHKQVARAWEIVNHQQQEQDVESNKELSVQVSSTSQGNSMGSTGQGDSISQGDSMSSTGQGDGMDISKANNVQEVVTSPRRTQSGKVVRYRDE